MMNQSLFIKAASGVCVVLFIVSCNSEHYGSIDNNSKRTLRVVVTADTGIGSVINAYQDFLAGQRTTVFLLTRAAERDKTQFMVFDEDSLVALSHTCAMTDAFRRAFLIRIAYPRDDGGSWFQIVYSDSLRRRRP